MGDERRDCGKVSVEHLTTKRSARPSWRNEQRRGDSHLLNGAWRLQVSLEPEGLLATANCVKSVFPDVAGAESEARRPCMVDSRRWASEEILLSTRHGREK